MSAVYGGEMAVAPSLESAPKWASELLETERVGHLGLIDDGGHPRVLPITFARVGNEVWSAIDRKPKRVPGSQLARVRWLKARPSSTLTVDRYDDDWARLAWVQLLGHTEIVDLDGHDDVLEAIASRYAQYREQPPPGPLLRLTPSRVVCWRVP
jgi:PPOX class probable F420-dependent enzyme